MRDTKIQTGLRIPEKRYDEISQIALRSGISINAAILLLVDIGLEAVSLGTQAEARVPAHTARQSGGESAQQGY